MKTKLMFYGGITFLIVGFMSRDNMLYYFFAVHLLTLALGFFLYKREKKRTSKEPLPKVPGAQAAK